MDYQDFIKSKINIVEWSGFEVDVTDLLSLEVVEGEKVEQGALLC